MVSYEIQIAIPIRVDRKRKHRYRCLLVYIFSVWSSLFTSANIMTFMPSLNILKVYQTIESHLRQFPSEAHRFPNFDPKRKPILARGSAGPLEGKLYSAEYFHGRYASSLFPYIIICSWREQGWFRKYCRPSSRNINWSSVPCTSISRCDRSVRSRCRSRYP